MAKRYLMRRGDGWEALEHDENDPSRFEYKPLDTAQAERYYREGGFSIVKPEEFTTHLRTVSDAVRAARRAARPTEAVLRRANPEGTEYEALEYDKADPRRATFTKLRPEQVGRWRDEGGFQDVDEAEWARHRDRARGVEVAVSNQKIAPDFALDEEVPGLRESIAPALATRASESTTVEREPRGDEEYAQAVAQGDQQRFLRNLVRGGANVGRAIVGRDEREEYEADPDPVKRLVERRAMDAKARMSDPASPESRRLQAAVRAAMPGAYTPEQLEQIAAEDEGYITDFVKVRAAAEGRAQAAADAARRAKERQDFDAEQQRLGREATIRAAGIQAAGKRSEAEAERALKRDLAEMEAGKKTAGANVPGLEFEPGATPTADDAKRVKGVRAAANTMKSYTSQLRDLYRRNGASLVGENATRMRQLVTSIQLEAKTIAELGALSGPDQQLMERLAGANPTTLTGMVRGAFGLDDTGAALDQLDKWVDDKVQAMNITYGYRPVQAASAKPPDGGTSATQAKPAAQAGALPPPAILPNGKRAKRIVMPDGRVFDEGPDGKPVRIR